MIFAYDNRPDPCLFYGMEGATGTNSIKPGLVLHVRHFGAKGCTGVFMVVVGKYFAFLLIVV